MQSLVIITNFKNCQKQCLQNVKQNNRPVFLSEENGLNNVMGVLHNARMFSKRTDFLEYTGRNKGNGFLLGKVFGLLKFFFDALTIENAPHVLPAIKTPNTGIHRSSIIIMLTN